MKIDGACHCGRISYEAEVDPKDAYICHCSDCQAISGSAFRWGVTVAESNFRLLSGAPRTYLKKADSGAESHQVFCADCASPLYSFSLHDGLPKAGERHLNLRVGTARQSASLRPRLQLWCQSKQEWLATLDKCEMMAKE